MSPKRRSRMRKANRIYWIYLKLELEEQSRHVITKDIFTYIIQAAIRTLHGQVGAAVPLEIEDFDCETLEAKVKCPGESLIEVWSALTLYGNYDDQRCAFHVQKVASEFEEMDGNEMVLTEGEIAPK